MHSERLTNPRHTSHPGAWTLLIAVFSLVALVTSIYLAWVALSGSKVAGCDSGQILDCSHVLTSRWSTALYVPVSVPAAGLYATLITCLFYGWRRPPSVGTRRAVAICAFAAATAGIWFISLQILVLKHLCLYCLVAHGCGLAIAAIVIFRWGRDLQLGQLAAIGASATMLLIALQVFGPTAKTFAVERHLPVASDGEISTQDPDSGLLLFDPDEEDAESSQQAQPLDPQEPTVTPANEPTSNNDIDTGVQTPANPTPSLTPIPQAQSPSQQTNKEEPHHETETATSSNQPNVTSPARRVVSAAGGTLKLDIRQWPRIGSPAAPLVLIEMFDYACPHCRQMHKTIKQAQATLGNRLVILALPVPMNAECNDTVRATKAEFYDACTLAQLAIAVWRIAPAQFPAYHDWLFATETTRSAAEARNQAIELVGEQRLAAQFERGIPAKYLSKHVQMYKMMGAGVIPKLLFPNSTVVGQVESSSHLVDMIVRESQPPAGK